MIVRPFRRVAVVNRGEAAVRFMRAAHTWQRARREPLDAVALYTHEDVDAPFVRMANAAICIGDALVPGEDGKLRSAYLDMERILDLVAAAGADAVWPGWGFVAERPEFADACAARGIVFIGPSGESMRMLGDKVAAKRRAEQASVPVSPWSGDPVSDAKVASEIAARIGYPVLLKASAGGGGRGIRRVDEPQQLEAAFAASTSEAAAAFGDPAVFVESFVPVARHIEVQVLADSHGTVWALGTRDCSLQRRHQKLLEEAPAPGLAPEVEKAMCDAAISLARHCRYLGAGTAEFLLLPDLRTFYFLEMNTRLQVEHTVTEEIFGVDLVELQIMVARGEKLPAPTPPAPRGAAIEARINAEDPDENFAPRAGGIVRFTPPQGPGVRVDSGYDARSTVPTAFDSMLAKVIARGADREQALVRLASALRETVIVLESGMTNRSLLLEVITDTPFREAPVSTRWLDGYLTERPRRSERPHLAVALAAAAIGDYRHARRGYVANFLDDAQRGLPRAVPEPGPTRLRYVVDGQAVMVEVATVAPSELRMRCGDWDVLVRGQSTGERTLVLDLGGERYSIQHVSTATEVYVEVEGVAHRFRRVSDGRVRAPLPASVAQVHVQPGDRVQAGERVITIEVMKMESAVEAPMAGVVRAVHVRPSTQVAAGEVLVELEQSGDESSAESAQLKLPVMTPAALDPLQLLESRVRGFDIGPDEAKAAIAALDRDPSPPRERLLRLLRAAVVQEQLFKTGPYDDARNDARESTLEQLAWFVHHRTLETERLSSRFVRRLKRFLELHDVREVTDSVALRAALLRLFQARHEPQESTALVLAVLHALARSTPPDPAEAERAVEQRVIFEKLANEAVQRLDLQVATAAWNLIYRWLDEPARRAEREQLSRDAVGLLARFAAAATAPERAELERQLLALPLAALVGALGQGGARSEAQAALAMLLERLYGTSEQEAGPLVLGRVPQRAVWPSRSRKVIGLMLQSAADIAPALEALPEDAESDLLLGAAPEMALLETAAAKKRARWTVLWSDEGGALRSRTFRARNDVMEEDRRLRDSHPASPMVRELERFAAFTLTRLPAPPGVLLMRLVAKGDERMVALTEVERFTPRIDGHFVRIPALEQAFLEAAQALRVSLRAAGPRPPALNRIVLCIRPTLALTQEQLHALAERLLPSTFDLGMEKVSLLGRFDFGDGEGPRPLAVELRDPITLGPRLEIVAPRQRPVAVRTAYEQNVLAARRRRLFYPYELIAWLTGREGPTRVERGQFEELELDAAGARLESAGGRPFGENPANVVVGRIVNWSPRFPEGIARVLMIGDPIREMGSLGEPECRRLIAAIDYAEEHRLPVEWVSISAGAKIAFDCGTEALDWIAAVLRRIVEFTTRGGVMNLLVDGPCVGGQSYWNAEATMLMHCKGTLVMTPRGYMVLTGKQALDVSGSVSAATNEAIGGLDIMEPNGQAQYTAPDLYSAYQLLLRHYEYTYVGPAERIARKQATSDPVERDVSSMAYTGAGGFARVGDIFTATGNPGRKKPFAIREVLTATLDQDAPPLERWSGMAGGETAVVLHSRLGGQPVCMIGIESQPLARRGPRPVDGPSHWTSGTLFPHSSRKVARAIQASSALTPVVVLANLSGFDGSPESLRERQLEYGAEIGKAVVEFDGPMLFCVIARYHGGAYVVFSRRLNERLEVLALEGSYASVIGGGAAAAVVFARRVAEQAQSDARVMAARAALSQASDEARREAQEAYERALATAETDAQNALAREFDTVHSVERALAVGSLDAIVPASGLRRALCSRLDAAVAAYLAR
jgi:acetyl/propionyl-CoA carboxylase alpha subunit/acetyl-CoA carboxylase carboxyltransferase component